jgi:hypothetical protein
MPKGLCHVGRCVSKLRGANCIAGGWPKSREPLTRRLEVLVRPTLCTGAVHVHALCLLDEDVQRGRRGNGSPDNRSPRLPLAGEVVRVVRVVRVGGELWGTGTDQGNVGPRSKKKDLRDIRVPPPILLSIPLNPSTPQPLPPPPKPSYTVSKLQ